MLYNPITKDLFTHEKQFLKKVYCPYVLNWDDDLSDIEGSKNRLCAVCDKTVVETRDLSDNDLLAMIDEDPDLCVKFELDQDNICVTMHKITQER